MVSFTNNSFLIDKNVLLVRFGGEIGIKSRQTRRRMVEQLRRNIESFLDQYPTFKVLEFRDRLLIYFESDLNLNKVSHLIVTSISGISSVSPAFVIEATEKAIVSKGLDSVINVIQPCSSFAVRVRREGNHPFSSIDIARILGAKILSTEIEGIKVDLETPDYQIFLDIRGSLAFIFTEVIKGIDGIPSQTQGTAIALIRPNFNSILAAWLMKKRGVRVIPVFFRTGKSSEEKFLNHVRSQFNEDPIIVSIKGLLVSFKNHSSLCFLCQVFCETMCQKVANEQKISVIISPTCFNFNNETMSLEALEFIEERVLPSVIRPIQFGFFARQGIRMDQLDQIPCCPFREKVSIEIFNDFNDLGLEKVLSKLEEYSVS
ncbi:MAG: THUMP domain-containing protein [Promethearchaeota archaeon]